MLVVAGLMLDQMRVDCVVLLLVMLVLVRDLLDRSIGRLLLLLRATHILASGAACIEEVYVALITTVDLCLIDITSCGRRVARLLQYLSLSNPGGR